MFGPGVGEFPELGGLEFCGPGVGGVGECREVEEGGGSRHLLLLCSDLTIPSHSLQCSGT